MTKHNVVRNESFTERLNDLTSTRIRRVLAMFDYPPEEEREAVDLVLKQMEIVAALWAPAAK
ncbi:hypothetical protein ACWD0J_29250 [Streptomyces sp. NPDC003011]